MINQDDPNDLNQNPNIINPAAQPNVQANQPFQPRQKGTGFTNIKRVLGANVGAGQQLAGRIGAGITGQANRVRENLAKQKEQFQTGFQQSRQESLANIGSATQLTKQPGESNEQYEARMSSQTPDYSQIGQNLRSAEYTGPTGFQNPNLLLNQAQTAGRLGTFSRSGLGQGILARQYGAGRGNYTSGQNILDQMFLSQDPNAQRTIQQARQNIVGLTEGVQGAAAAAAETAEATRLGVEQSKVQALQDIQNSLGSVVGRGSESARQFYSDRDRFNQLMTATKSTDSNGNPVYKDPSGNEITLTDRDYQLIDNPSQFGLDAGNIIVGAQNQQTEQQAQARKNEWAGQPQQQNRLGGLKFGERYSYDDLVALSNNPYDYGSKESDAYEDQVLRGRNFSSAGSWGARIPSPSANQVKSILNEYVDPTENKITQGILQDIAKSGTATNTNAIRYNPEQEATARNLQLLMGSVPKAYTPFETDLYGIDSSNIANKSSSYDTLKRGLGYDPRNENERQANLANQAAQKINALTTNPIINTNGDILSQINQLKSQTQNYINEMLQTTGSSNDDQWTQAYNDRVEFLNKLNNIQNEYQNELGINRTTSLQNYLANLYSRPQQT
jgi:hypothetical protein